MKFIVDSMLGKLAKRMRILGLDTHFDPSLDDRAILKISKAEDRMIVTRDTGIKKIHGAKVILIASTDIDEQLKEFHKTTGIGFDSKASFTRCPSCNTPVEDIAKEKAKDMVPKLVYDSMDKFSYCPKCKKAYWQGTHFDKLTKELKGI